MDLPRILFAAGASGSGKTLITCGFLQIMKNRGKSVISFKCGPDYIDPMFHSQVIGTKSRNLDAFLTKEEGTKKLLEKNGYGYEIAVLEGVMGYYDGLGGVSTIASTYDVARVTDTSVVLIVNCKGMSNSVIAYIQGFLNYREDSRIQGVILNQMSPMLYRRMKEQIENELPVKVYGYVPMLTDCVLESRHLGLILPEEIRGLQEKVQCLAMVMEESLDIDGLITLAEKYTYEKPGKYVCEETECTGEHLKCICGHAKSTQDEVECIYEEAESTCEQAECVLENGRSSCRIALARDEAFCFIYEDNLELLRELGAEIIEFSPIHDRKLPNQISGLLLYGGYPELYASELSRNISMRNSIKEAVDRKVPCIAECGGFMYLQDSLEDMDGNRYEMTGAIPGYAFRTEKLSRFGYITLEGGCVFGKEVGEISAHEFHYFDSVNNGEDFTAKKPVGARSWKCIHSTETLLAGFPHIHFYANRGVAEAFITQCKRTYIV